MELSVKTVAYRNAPEDMIKTGEHGIRERFPDIAFRFVNDDPDVIYFLSGGSEQDAIKTLRTGKHVLLLADFHGNAYAAATEVKAWAEGKGLSALLVSIHECENTATLFDYAKVCSGFKLLKNKQAGLIGNVSHWLVASTLPLFLAKDRFGIYIKHFQWESLPDYLSFEPDPVFLETYHSTLNKDLINEAKIFSFLQAMIHEHKLNGLTLECFNMVNDRHVTACLALALLNSRGIVAGCEGDLVSLTGMMLIQALTGSIPWMANVAGIRNNCVLFAHCTAPLNLLDNFKVQTHFETGKSAAIQGDLSTDEFTIFRLSQCFDKAFISSGKVFSKPNHDFACRTQIELALPEKDAIKLRNHPLGNHHLIIPGQHKNLLTMACQHKQITLV